MFDPITRELIQSAPELPELDRERLPEELARAYAEIVSVRSRLLTSSDELDAHHDTLHRLAVTYEAYTSSLPDRDDRAAAAYVSGTAYRLLHLMASIRQNGNEQESKLARDFVSHDVSAVLLFLIAGYSSDAVEMATHLVGSETSDLESFLLPAIVRLANGRLDDIRTSEVEFDVMEMSNGLDEAASTHLYARIHDGIVALAGELLSFETSQETLTSQSIFRGVMDDSVEALQFGEQSVVSAFSGPHHLASLLLHVGGVLGKGAIIHVPPPSGIAPSDWVTQVEQFANSRPYLWQNHLAAINHGFLEPGNSSAISFPTGAGKSTLAELKTAVARIQEKKVLFLLPTHALVSQVSSSLRSAFPDSKVRTSFLTDGEYAETEGVELPDIAIMTPERCLALLGISPDSFSDLGLVILDECHLLHPRDESGDRRSIDTMLCLLHLFQNASTADFVLMSAMMKNVSEIAGWIADATGHGAIALDLQWKPTRQARGCVVYEGERFSNLVSFLNTEQPKAETAALKRFREWQSSGKKGRKPSLTPAPNKKIKEKVLAQPFGFFSLKQTWLTKQMEDYAFLPLLENEVPLEANKFWRLTANRNVVAAILAARLAHTGVKTLVFAQQPSWAESIARNAAEQMLGNVEPCSLTEVEEDYLRVAIEEAGGKAHVYTPTESLAACHHSLLLQSERLLNESLFSRGEGISVLAATPTLAQGMNLPAEVVIIAGDDRFEAEANESKRMEAHELLNAAGRAGRAGHVSQGLVLIIPGSVYGLDVDAQTISNDWFDLQEIFAQPDKCLDIKDGIETVLDAIQSSSDDENSLEEYLLRRLPVSDESGEKTAGTFLARSLGAYKARSEDKWDAFQAKIATAIETRSDVIDDDNPTWKEKLATRTGMPVSFIDQLSISIGKMKSIALSPTEWCEWFFVWLGEDEKRLYEVVSVRTLQDVRKVGMPKKKERTTSEAIDFVCALSKSWMLGATLCELEIQMGIDKSKLKKCNNARKFVTKWIREISYGLGIVAQVYRVHLDHSGAAGEMPIGLATLAACAREGVATPELLALRYQLGIEYSRNNLRNVLQQFEDEMGEIDTFELFSATQARVKTFIDRL